ncbi:hypothetical protein NSP_48270 [Nodularia spumigena CCY9414]|jgi:hypothetical protein|nr:hypothetical protein NSP_48270 [Nodularia spumigena CCY9414]
MPKTSGFFELVMINKNKAVYNFPGVEDFYDSTLTVENTN